MRTHTQAPHEKSKLWFVLLLSAALCFGCVTASPTGSSAPSASNVPAAAGPTTGAAPATNIDGLAQRLADQLDMLVPLGGKKIQVSDNNLWQGATKLNLPFSTALADALGVALSQRGATVTVQEVGDEPMILLGSYDIDNVLVAATVKIRKMGETHSQDVAMARGEILKSRLDPKWFAPEFPRVARTIVRLLEDNFMSRGFYQIDVEIPDLKPGMYGQPNLCLEKEFSRSLENAVSKSSVFRSSGVTGKSIVKARMDGKYVKLGDNFRFHVNVIDSLGKTLSSAVFDVAIASVPAALQRPCATTEQSVCVDYRHQKGAGISASSYAVSTLVNNTSEALAESGLTPGPCSKTRGGAKVILTMNVRTKMEFGKKAAKATVNFKVLDSKGKVVGSFSESGVTFRPQIDDAAEMVVNQIFEDENIGEKLATIILGRK